MKTSGIVSCACGPGGPSRLADNSQYPSRLAGNSQYPSRPAGNSQYPSRLAELSAILA